jgi:DNA-binding Lrp family transcriptional regulator
VSPPDDLDRRIFSMVQSMGSARTTQLHQALGPEVPLRTLQRRMQKLARRGLLEKHGTRKDAFYRLPLRGPIP